MVTRLFRINTFMTKKISIKVSITFGVKVEEAALMLLPPRAGMIPPKDPSLLLLPLPISLLLLVLLLLLLPAAEVDFAADELATTLKVSMLASVVVILIGADGVVYPGVLVIVLIG